MRITALFLYLLVVQSGYSQSGFERTHNDQKFSYYFSIYEKSEDVQCLDEPHYYWFDNKEIGRNQGGYQGDLLHGTYQAIDRENRLIHQGEFKKGLKSGIWKNWSVNGNLISIKFYRNGLIHGKVKNYREGNGKLKSVEKFKNGLKHGKQIEYLLDGTMRITVFKQGQEKSPKEKKTKKDKLKVLKSKKPKKDKPNRKEK